MKLAYVMFDQMTTMDFAGFYEVVAWIRVLGKVEDLTWDFCSNKEFITDDRGMTVQIHHVYPDLSQYDVVFIPGGMATRTLRHDPAFIAWIQTARDVNYKVSVCTGSLLFGAAGFLIGKRATTNPSAYELLRPYCAEVIQERIVRDGDIFMSGGAGTSLDIGLYFVESLTDQRFVERVQGIIDYPFYQAGNLNKQV
ncbi:DJ-1/PfpI family protein [Paenibacillus rhizovicinus]|uniref:DJ-1/PfpI family protein n=1 Tax=Paenibacillus rhizovicinus TaxID=2704463 RepID=A0A6C0P7X7_9BACL|nr:DJ-1/PfpI family protein [Paenibacillus rhizovicinus]QHW34740.1 DJ-1/PfpI family protein [Paenibacillus rhizovicinus]